MNSTSMHQPDLGDIESDEVVRTERELARYRDVSVARLRRLGETGPIVFTCDGCHHRTYCRYAFDAYNTDGDCLADK